MGFILIPLLAKSLGQTANGTSIDRALKAGAFCNLEEDEKVAK